MGLNSTNPVIRNQGFTLIELLISLTIIGVILVVIFGAFRISVQAWEKGEAQIVAHQKQRIILQRLGRQLAAAFSEKIAVDNDEEAYFFKAGESELEFISDLSLIPGNDYGRVYVYYRFSSDAEGRVRLAVFEKNLAFLREDLKDVRPSEDEFRVLIQDIAQIGFAYLKMDGQRQSWSQRWELNKDDGLPDAVKIQWQLTEKMPPVEMMTRIASHQKAEG